MIECFQSDPVARPGVLFGRASHDFVSHWPRLESDCSFRLFSNSLKLI